MSSFSAFGPGITLAAGAASSSAALPLQGASLPRMVRVASTGPAYVRIGGAGVTAVAGDMMVVPSEALVLNVAGCSQIAVLQVSAAATVQVSAVDAS